MRAVFVNVDALHLFGVDVPGDVRPLVNDEDGLASGFCLLGENGAVEAGTDDEVIVHSMGHPFVKQLGFLPFAMYYSMAPI